MTTDNRQTTITASDFVAQDYAGKVARGECDVLWFKHELTVNVLDVRRSPVDETLLVTLVSPDGLWESTIGDDTPMYVEWLTPATAVDAGELAGDMRPKLASEETEIERAVNEFIENTREAAYLEMPEEKRYETFFLQRLKLVTKLNQIRDGE